MSLNTISTTALCAALGLTRDQFKPVEKQLPKATRSGLGGQKTWPIHILPATVSINRGKKVLSVRKAAMDYQIADSLRASAPENQLVPSAPARPLTKPPAMRHEAEGNALTPEEWKSLPSALENEREAYFDKIDQKMIYVLPALDGDRSIKLAVQVDFLTGHPKQAINAARAGFKVDANAFQDKKRYERVE